MSEYTVTVMVGFPVSAAKAKAVLERWWKEKERRREYMRVRRAGRKKAGVP